MKRMSLREYKLLPYNGKLMPACELIKLPEAQVGLTVTLLRHRVCNKGMDVHTALTTPVTPRQGYVIKIYGSSYSSVKELCLELEMKYSTFCKLLRECDMNAEKAFERYCKKRTYETFLYKGSELRICDLVNHPDNIYGITASTIRSRLNARTWNNDDVLSKPKRPILNGTKINYRGEVFSSLSELCSAKGIVGFYSSLVSCICDKKREVLLDKILGFGDGH